MQRRGLYAKAFAELIVSLVVRPDRIFRKKLRFSGCIGLKKLFQNFLWGIVAPSVEVLCKVTKTDFKRVRARDTLIRFLSVALVD